MQTGHISLIFLNFAATTTVAIKPEKVFINGCGQSYTDPAAAGARSPISGGGGTRGSGEVRGHVSRHNTRALHTGKVWGFITSTIIKSPFDMRNGFKVEHTLISGNVIKYQQKTFL